MEMALKGGGGLEEGDVSALRQWLRACPAIGRKGLFGVEFLGDAPGDCALFALPGGLKYRENILGERTLLHRQSREFLLALRGSCGPEARLGLESLKRLRETADWILSQSMAGRFPEWTSGTVTAVTALTDGAAERFDGDSARYGLRLRVDYRIQDKEIPTD